MEPTAPIRVLVVDDEEAIVELVAEYLRARGMEVVTAADGDRALAALEGDRVDVVLTDLRLPVRGGMSLLEAIVERAVPVATVVMTGYGTIETATQALKLGASEYLLKPVRLRELHEALHTALNSLHRAQARERAVRQVALYEALLGLGPTPGADELLQRLAAHTAELLGQPVAWVLEHGPRSIVAGSPSATALAMQVGTAPGPALRLMSAPGQALPATHRSTLERLGRAALDALSRGDALARGDGADDATEEDLPVPG